MNLVVNLVLLFGTMWLMWWCVTRLEKMLDPGDG